MVEKRALLIRSLRLPLGALLALIALFMIGGGIVDPARASLPAQEVSSVISDREDTLVIRVYFRDMAERDRLATELAAEEVSTVNGFLTVTGSRHLFASLLERGLRVEIDEEATRIANEFPGIGNSAPGTFFGGYRTVEEMQAFLDAKVAAYPNLVEKIDIGDSWCKTHPGQCTQPDSWNGYDLWVLRITNRSIPGPKPVFWFDAGTHPIEIVPPEVAMRFIDYLLQNYNSNADARWLIDYHDIYVMPMLNPDGHHIVENGASQPRSQRKNADRDDGCITWPPPGFGTDLNRNFPYRWGCCGGSSGSPCADMYRGPSAVSEEETQAVTAKIRTLIPDQRGPLDTDPAPITTTGILQSMHTVASLNLYAWGWTNSDSSNHADLDNIARHMSATNAYPPGNNYQPCQPGECLYLVEGDSLDWQYGELGVPGYTTELHGGTPYPPYSQVESIYTTNRGMLLYMAKIARTPYLTTRGPDTVSPVTNPMTTTQGTPVDLTATINYNWTGAGNPNRYLQNVGGAEYYIGTPPWSGGSPLPMQAVDGAFDEQNEPVQATIDTSSIPPGTYVVFVRGRGVNDYQGFGSWGPVSATWLTITPASGPTPTATPLGCGIATHDISIIDFAFEPRVTIVRQGSTVRWTNNGQVPHTTTSVFGVWDSGVLNPGEQFSFTLNNVGPFQYSCTIHPDMVAVIAVTTTCPTPPTSTRTSTLLPTNTVGVPSPTSTRTTTQPVPSGTVPVPTSTQPVVTSTQPLATDTPGTPGPATSTPTACTLTFTDVPPSHTFYANIRCLACRGVISGYADGTFRPGNSITRGQIAKIVSNAAGYSEPIDGQTYEDVPPQQTFYVWIERLSRRGHMGGYPCGGAGEPCGPENRPYFRPGNTATRAQMCKIVSNAAGYNDDPGPQRYEDVPPNHPFFVWIQRMAIHGVIGGYPCGGPGEPYGPLNLPYFRPYNNVTRGQSSKIVADTFFPGCETPGRR